MVSTSVFLSMLLTVPVLFPVGAQAQDFLRKVSTHEIENDLETSLTDLLGGHSSPAASKRLSAIEASLWQTFQSLPKNKMGRLSPTAVRYVVHGYFAREHGWQIKGLEPHGMQMNATIRNVHNVNILQEKAPLLVEGLLEARNLDRGLGLTDVVAMVSVLEQLVFDESLNLLEAAYHLNGESLTGYIDEATLHKVLKSYLILFGQGSKANLFDAAKHQAQVAARPREDIDDFEGNAVLNFNYARRHQTNPFVPRRYSFQVASEIVGELAQRYGKWQNAECRDMKNHLIELDSEGSGRVPLGLLYAQPASASYHFSESIEYLRKIGAVDETSSVPKVLIANYVTGPSNCIASSSYYSVCCLNNCDSIMDEIEHKVLASAASPERLLGLVRNISNVRTLPQGLPEKLQSIADQHGGEVPLHGRLFAQWLHFAFPHECNYPSLLESSDMLASSQWSSSSYSASSEERMNHVQSVRLSELAEKEIKVDELWSDQEVLPALEEPQPPFGRAAAGVIRVAVQLAALFLGLRSIMAAWKAAVGAGDGKKCKQDSKKDDDLVLGFRV